MSTKLTKKDIPMIESQSLKLVLEAEKINRMISSHVSQSLKSQGYPSASPAVLDFLSALDCGVNYASEIARTLGVSRQMVAKTVKEFCRLGYLEQVPDVGKQKKILFTELGEQLIADARKSLADLDKVLFTNIDKSKVENTVRGLSDIANVISNINRPKV